MDIEMLTKYIPWLLFACSLLYIVRCREQPQTVVKIERDTVVRLDTVLVLKPYPIREVRYVRRPTVYKVDTVQKIVYNLYSDTVEVEPEFRLYYNARVQGQLENISLSFYDNRPDKVLTETKTITEKHYKYLSGFYGGFQASAKGDITPSVLFAKDRFIGSVGYNITSRSLNVGLYFKLKPP